MSHYLLHHIRRDLRFNRECSKHIAARRLPNSTVLCPEFIVFFQYLVDDLTRKVSTAEKDSDFDVTPTGLVST